MRQNPEITTILLLISIFFFTSTLLPACNSSEKKQKEGPDISFKTLDTLVPFAGFWVNEIYVKNIARTRSPRECQNLLESCINIPTRTLKVTSMVSGFHEGAAGMTVLKNKDKFQFYYEYDDTIRNLAYDIQIISNEKIKIGKNTFVKTNEKFLEDILFSGEYLDSAGSKIQFLKDGHIAGLGSFTVYNPIYDYLDPGLDVDQIGLGESPKNITWFGFKFDQDTLLIYKLNCLVPDSTDNTCLKVENGDIKYKLIRIH
jgi:hypothetical protein